MVDTAAVRVEVDSLVKVCRGLTGEGKYLEVAPVVAWSWWVVFSPFGLAIAWWAWADSTGYTKNKHFTRVRHRQNSVGVGRRKRPQTGHRRAL